MEREEEIFDDLFRFERNNCYCYYCSISMANREYLLKPVESFRVERENCPLLCALFYPKREARGRGSGGGGDRLRLSPRSNTVEGGRGRGQGEEKRAQRVARFKGGEKKINRRHMFRQGWGLGKEEGEIWSGIVQVR